MSNVNMNPNVKDLGNAIPKELDSQQLKSDGKGPNFQQLLNNQLQKPEAQPQQLANIKFSKHAIERMHSRGVSLKPDQMQSLAKAVEKAEAKGAKNTLVLADNSAFVVSVENKTVITAIDKALMKENVFTNIDSTVVI